MQTASKPAKENNQEGKRRRKLLDPTPLKIRIALGQVELDDDASFAQQPVKESSKPRNSSGTTRNGLELSAYVPPAIAVW